MVDSIQFPLNFKIDSIIIVSNTWTYRGRRRCFVLSIYLCFSRVYLMLPVLFAPMKMQNLNCNKNKNIKWIELIKQLTHTCVNKCPCILNSLQPWCGHCKQLAPVLDEVAVLTEGTMDIGTIDATAHSSLASKYGVQVIKLKIIMLKLYRICQVCTSYGGVD